MTIIFCLLFCLNLIFVRLKEQNRIVIILSYIVLIILMSGNTEGPDVETYRYYYRQASAHIFLSGDFGYYLVECLCGKYFHMSFYLFRLILSVICILLIDSAFRYLDGNRHFGMVLYMGYPFFMDAIQIRNFVAISIVLYSLRYLVSTDKMDTLKYIVLVLVACSFHAVSMLFLLFLIYQLKNKKIVNKLLFFIGCVLFFVTYRYGNFVYSFFIHILFTERGLGYITTRTGISWAGVSLLYITNLIILMCLNTVSKKKSDDDGMIVIDYLWKSNCCLMIFLPLCLININYYRIFRNIYTLNIIPYILIIQTLSRKSLYRYFFVASALMLMFAWYIYDCMLLNDFERVVQPIFEHNIFFGVDKDISLLFQKP